MAAPFEYEATFASGQTGPWIPLEFVESAQFVMHGKINGKVTLLMLTLSPISSGSGYIETTTEPLDVVVENTVQYPVAWSHGTVSAQKQSIAWAPTAFRVVCTAGNIHVSARGI